MKVCAFFNVIVHAAWPFCCWYLLLCSQEQRHCLMTAWLCFLGQRDPQELHAGLEEAPSPSSPQGSAVRQSPEENLTQCVPPTHSARTEQHSTHIRGMKGSTNT